MLQCPREIQNGGIIINMRAPYRRLFMSVVLCLALLSESTALAQVGIVYTVEGQVSLKSGRQERVQHFGLDLDEGDAIRTSVKSWALLTMMDGTKITVRPDTEVRIYIYRYTESGESWQNRALLVLTRGALRVTSGRIAMGRSSGFAVRTPDATMDMRGADHDITYIAPKFTPTRDATAGTYGRTFTGKAVLRNPRGEVTIHDGQTAYAEPRMRIPPRVLSTNPHFFQWHSYVDRRVAAVAERQETVAP